MGPIDDGGFPGQNIYKPEDVRFLLGGATNLQRLQQLGTRWVRLWIRWDKAQLFPPDVVPISQLTSPANDAPGYGTGGGYRYIQAIDAQINLLRQAGIGVILTSWMFPRWANGTHGQPADWQRYDRGGPTTPVEQLKAMEYRIPVNQTGTQGYWGSWCAFLITHYAHHGCGLILELMNEPNLQWWPQQTGSNTTNPFDEGSTSVHVKVAEMMNTALTVSRFFNYPILLAAPALSDHMGASTRLRTNYLEMTDYLLHVLDGMFNFPHHPTFIWTHHNYIDVEQQTNRTQELRQALVGRWRGFSAIDAASGQHPSVWLTEGGARLSVVDRNTQAARVSANWAEMTNAAGIEMFANYLMFGSGGFQSGLREEASSGGAPRPVWNTFASFPGRA